MKVLSTIAAMRSACADLRHATHGPSSLGLVPTMGALHEGHRSLVRASKQRCSISAVSIFVNPTQFGPSEDLARYPRTFDEDCRTLEAENVDLLFAPDAKEIYPSGDLRTYVEVPGIGDRLDGRSRPGHFRGVATVVAKLFHIVTPDVAFFGQKDAAQVAVLRAMVRDLDFPLELAVCPTVRENDGLAMSSRNRCLSASDRLEARTLFTALRHAQAAAKSGVTDARKLRDLLQQQLTASPAIRVDYAEVVDPDTLQPLDSTQHGALVAVAAWIGNTRLIDNLLLPPSAPSEPAQ